ncbi:MAG TPA: hypothetical protein VFH44_08185 [Solirubrobacterales bacterium]|nr:hypothetical protein [Solirubrobacterales bacterium]
MTDQLQTVIAAAERAAEAIRRDAEEQARRHLAEAQRRADRMTAERVGLISELTDDLIRHATNVRDHSEQMVRALEDAIDSVTGKLEQPGLNDQLDIGAAMPSMPAMPAAPSQSPGPTNAAAQPAAPPQQDNPPAPPTPASPPAPSGAYTDIVGAPPPPPPAAAPAPVPPLPARHEIAIGPPQPTPEAAAAAAAAGASFGAAGRVAGPARPAVTTDAGPTSGAAPANPNGPEHVAQALDHARRLADAGTDRETIASVLRQLWGVSDPDPIVDRVLGGG